MQEAREMPDDTMVWAGTNFFGGLTRHREGVCGVVSAMAVYLGLRYRCSPSDTERFKTVNALSYDVAQSFKAEFGSIICQELLGITHFNEEERTRFFAEKRYETKCHSYIRFMIKKLFELDDTTK
jgi:hypothetical protein